MSTPTILAIIAIVALVVGIVSVIAGFGGGVFLVPFIFALFDYEFTIIVGSTLLAVIAFSIVGVLGAWRRKEIDYKLAIIFAIPSSIAVTNPFPSTLAMVSLLDSQVIDLSVALSGNIDAVRADVSPTTMFSSDGEMVISDTGTRIS